MRRIARLTLLYVLEAIAAILALSVVVFGAALWRLAEGPVNADMIRPVVTEVLLDAVQGDAAAIGDLSVSFDPSLAALVLTANEVSVARAGGEVLVASDQIEIALALDLLLVGRPAPVRLSATGGTVWLYRDALGRVNGGLGGLDLRPQATAGGSGSGEAEAPDLEDPGSVFARLLSVQLSNVRLQVRDELSDWTGLFTDMQASFELNNGSASLDAEGGLVTSAGLAPLVANVEAGRDLQSMFMEVRVSNLVPAATAPLHGPLSGLSGLDAPFEAHLVFDASRQEGLRAADLQITGGEGVLRADGRSVPLQTAEIDLNLDVEAGELVIHQARLASDLISFDIQGRFSDLSGFDNALPARARYALQVGPGRLDLGGVFPEPLVWEAASLSGGLDANALEVGFDALQLSIPNADIDFTGAVSLEQTAAGWRPNVRFEGPIAGRLSKADVLRHWPTDFALGARDWIRDSILDGRLSDARLRMDLRAQHLAEKLVPDEALSLRFRFTDADVRYMSTMTPLLGLSGQAELRGNSLSLQGAGGGIGAIAAEEIFVDIPRLNPKGAPARFGGRGRGGARDFLELVSQPPLNLAANYGVDPAAFAGDGVVAFEISRPMLRSVPAEDLGYSVQGEFTNVSGPVGPPGLELANGVIALSITPEGLRAEGQADIAEARADLVWTETFGLDETQMSTAINLNARMTARDLDRVGLPVRRFLDGGVGVQARLEGRAMAFSAVDVTLDLQDTAIALPAALWEKSPGEPAAAHVRANLQSDGALVLESLRLDGGGVRLDTSASIAADGRLLSAQAREVFIEGRMDLNAQIDRPDGPEGQGLRVRVGGAFLDAEDLFGLTAPQGGGALDAELDFEGDLDRVLVRGQPFEDVGLIVQMRPQGVARFVLEADGATGPLIVRFEPEPETGVRRLSALGPDAGVMLSAFAGFDNIMGGPVQLYGEAPPLGVPGGVSGRLEVGAFTLDRMPLLARILAAGSLEGLGGLLSGQGIGFERLETDFVWDDGVLAMRESRVAGPSLGATWSGLVDFTDTRLDVDGTLLPSYGMNSILGSVPLVGELLTSRRGEGVIGVTFSVSGPFDETRVTANPLSALAPGVLRRIFEGTSAERELDALENRRRSETQAQPEEPGEAPAPTQEAEG